MHFFVFISGKGTTPKSRTWIRSKKPIERNWVNSNKSSLKHTRKQPERHNDCTTYSRTDSLYETLFVYDCVLWRHTLQAMSSASFMVHQLHRIYWHGWLAMTTKWPLIIEWPLNDCCSTVFPSVLLLVELVNIEQTWERLFFPLCVNFDPFITHT